MPSCAARTSAIGVTPGNACGNGSTPASRRRSSFARRSSVVSDTGVNVGGRTKRPRAAAPADKRELSGVDLRDLQLAGGALRHRHRDDVAALVADQGATDGRLVREALLGRVGLRRADDLELLRLVGLLVLDVDCDADRHSVAGSGRVNDRCRAQLVLEIGDLLLQHRLLVLRVVVLRVLGDVSELAGGADPLGHLAPTIGRQVVDLLLELFEPLWGEDDVSRHEKGPTMYPTERSCRERPLPLR